MWCVICEQPLKGRQRRFCSSRCQVKGQSNADYTNQKARGWVRKLRLVEAKGARRQRCGYNRCMRALTFHHRDPSIKAFPLDARACSNRSEQSLAAEAAKCDLLCMNCHAEVEDEIVSARIQAALAAETAK